MSSSRAVFALPAMLVLSACTASPRPLAANEDVCDFCRMTVVDVRMGGEVLSAGGRLHTFDSIACLTGFLRSGPPGSQGEPGVWVADYSSGRMVPVDSAVFLRDSRIRSPMAGSDGDLIAFAPGVPGGDLVARFGGTVVTWAEALAAPGHAEPSASRATVVPAVPPPR